MVDGDVTLPPTDLKQPAMSTQSRLRMTSAERIASAASGASTLVPGAPACK